MTVKLMKRVFSRCILVTLDMNKQECYAQLNHDYTSTQVILYSKFFVRGGQCMGGGPHKQLECSDLWGQVGVIGGGGLLPVHWDSMTGKG